MKKAIIIGATGFGGLGLVEIIRRHPEMKITQLVDIKDPGKSISDVFPHLRGFCDLIIRSPKEINFDDMDIAFFSTPDRAGMSLIREFYKKNIPVIDFSGDFRFGTTEEYAVYAANRGLEADHLAADLLPEAVYGLPEKYADRIKGARIVGNPGCFSTCMILGLLPATESGIISSDTIICDGKTGVSGAGRNSGEANLYPQRHENVNTYREGKHQHVVEVENVLKSAGGRDRKILFVPQIVPLNRGILTTMYMDIEKGCDTEGLLRIYRDYYERKPFVMITDKSPNTADVRGSNRCLIRPLVDGRTGKLVVISVIDNLMKGQAGNAVQNANIMLGFDETAGLDVPAFYP
ncbi:MAG: N-acetyl-gamma-glutamyl-phosphate reductase [Spirochaetes bacterium RBG_13_51_14]|nr:MAG: N-acetyl-gamma-glutamyl-phosphate reductase [Spirochaetes bacterium RBG_13_51_14]